MSIREARYKLAKLARRAEGGDTIIVTRHGKPVSNLVTHEATETGINRAALDAFKM
jgi:prevent-host-death family protein